MDPEKKNETGKDFGKVVEALRTKQKLPSLRTYQGDMAEFIKEKNESVVSIALKEKKGKEKKQKAEEVKTQTAAEPVRRKGGLRQNLPVVVLSLLLTALGAGAVYFVFQTLSGQSPDEAVIEDRLISYNNLVTLSPLTRESLQAAMANASLAEGISLMAMPGANGMELTVKEFFGLLQVILPSTLSRTLQEDYAVGTLSENGTAAKFVIITVSDFGRAFSAMLEWEANLESDLSFLSWKPLNPVATTTEEAALGREVVSQEEGSYAWKDVIVRNKDVRALVNERGESKIAYSFLDKNTILIVDDLSAVGKLLSVYVSHVVR